MATDPLSQDAIEALIDAAIDCEVLYSPGTSDFLKQGGYYVQHSATGGETLILPGRGAPTPETAEYGVEVLDPGTFSVNGQSASAMYRKWEDRFNEMFYPFQTMPQPEDFDAVIDSFEPVLRLLSVNPEAFANATPDGEEPLDLEPIDGGNDNFTLVSSASTIFGQFQGLTSDSFRKYVLDRFPLITQRQFAAAQMVKASVLVEQEVWKSAHEDVKSLVANATRAFESNGGSTAGDTDFAVPLAVLGVAALIPGVGVYAGAAAAGIGLLAVLPKVASEPWEYDFDATGAEAIWGKLVGHVDKLKELAGDQERGMAGHMTAISELLAGDPGRFDVSVLDDPTDADSVSESQELQEQASPDQVIGTIDLNYDIVVQTGNDLQFVSQDFGTAATELSGVLSSSGDWSRPGGIGLGYVGHYEETAALAQTLVNTLTDTKQSLHRAGESIKIAALQIQGRDEEASRQLDELVRRIAAAEEREAQVRAGTASYH